MTIWDLAKVGEVYRMQVDALVDIEMLQRSGAYTNVPQITVDAMIEQLLEGIHTLAVEADMLDFRLKNWTDQARDAQHYQVRWSPRTKNAGIELVGGPKDGELLTVEDINDPVFFADQLAFDWGKTRPEDPAWRTLTYELSGWHEQQRHWMFTLKP